MPDARAVTHSPKLGPPEEASRLRRPLPRDLEGLLDTYRGCEVTRDRAEVARALVALGAPDERVGNVLVDLLAEDPVTAAQLLAARADRRAIRRLGEALDRLIANPIGDCPACAAEHVTGVMNAMLALGGTITEDQHEAVHALQDRAFAMMTPVRTWPPVPARSFRIGRNAPCPCGSGKKAKKCCGGS